MAEWVIAHLGYPVAGQSLDRINNDGHYEPGNLRWATTKQQNGNKRPYRGAVYGQRIKGLVQATGYSYESIRTFINQGVSDDEIRNRKRRPSGRPRVRHN